MVPMVFILMAAAIFCGAIEISYDPPFSYAVSLMGGYLFTILGLGTIMDSWNAYNKVNQPAPSDSIQGTKSLTYFFRK
jgi:hypothetical protein